MTLKCWACESIDGVQMESSRTAYQLPDKTLWDHIKDVEPENPNADIPLCRACAVEHHSEWDEHWNEYYAGLL